MWKRRSQCEWDQVGDIGRNALEYCAQKDAYATDQTSNDIWGRNVGYNEATRTLDSGKRYDNAKVDVRNHT